MKDVARELLSDCRLCPRSCGVNRLEGKGFCGEGEQARVALASLHPWEEPIIAGENGAGTVFFSGCSLRCIFCQNYEISHQQQGIAVSDDRLGEIFLEQQQRGAATLDLVTPTHFVPQIINGIIYAQKKDFSLPVAYNSSGYENLTTIDLLQDYVDIYLPDLKYYSGELSGAYSMAADYFQVASSAIGHMVRQTGSPKLKGGVLQRGVLVRHMVLPGARHDSMKLLDWLWHEFGDDIYLSIMSQYTPAYRAVGHPKLRRRVTSFEYDSVVDYAADLGFSKCFIQDRRSAKEEYVPQWTGDGVR